MYGFVDTNNIDDNESLEKIYEYSIKELKSMSLPQVVARVKTQNLRVTYLGVDKKGIINFKCTSGTTPGKFWYQKIKLLDLPQLVEDNNRDKSKGKKGYLDKELVNLAVFGDISVYCNDLSFKYYGWQYMAFVGGYGLKKETRYPRLRNPYLKGRLCKHLCAVFNVMPMMINTFVRDFRKQGLL